MTLYREMDVATAKPSNAERARVPHHLLDLADPGEEFSVAQFQRLAFSVIEEIESRQRRVLLVGGTGLYLRSIVDQLAFPGRYPEVADRLALLAGLPEGAGILYERLVALDPLAASRIEPGNTRRILRALEVTIGSGRTFSSFGPGLESYPTSDAAMVGIVYKPEQVAAMIEERVARWLEQGWVAEVERLVRRPGGLSRTARQALGYKEILAHIEEGEELDACVRTTVERTKTMARRQWAWFRRDPRILWVEHTRDLDATLDEAYEATAWPPTLGIAPKWENRTVRQTPRPVSIRSLVKAEGTGNDFLVIERAQATDLDARDIVELCDRHRGIGADGLLVASKGATCDLEMTLYNADGSRAEMSGNGIRCLVAVANWWGWVNEGAITVATDAGVRLVEWSAGTTLGEGFARVAMGKVTLGGSATVPIEGARAVHVDVGNPHIVALIEREVAQIDLATVAGQLALGTDLGVNLEVINVVDRDEIDLVVFERGVGITRACGTGSCAAAAVAHSFDLVGTTVKVHNPGGTLEVRIDPDGEVTLGGPARVVATIGVDVERLLERRES